MTDLLRVERVPRADLINDDGGWRAPEGWEVAGADRDDNMVDVYLVRRGIDVPARGDVARAAGVKLKTDVVGAIDRCKCSSTE